MQICSLNAATSDCTAITQAPAASAAAIRAALSLDTISPISMRDSTNQKRAMLAASFSPIAT
jgi:hypothetical protein